MSVWGNILYSCYYLRYSAEPYTQLSMHAKDDKFVTVDQWAGSTNKTQHLLARNNFSTITSRQTIQLVPLDTISMEASLELSAKTAEQRDRKAYAWTIDNSDTWMSLSIPQATTRGDSKVHKQQDHDRWYAFLRVPLVARSWKLLSFNYWQSSEANIKYRHIICLTVIHGGDKTTSSRLEWCL